MDPFCCIVLDIRHSSMIRCFITTILLKSHVHVLRHTSFGLPGLQPSRKLGRHLAVVKSSNSNQEPSHQGPPCPGKSSGAQLCDNAGTHDMIPTHRLHT